MEISFFNTYIHPSAQDKIKSVLDSTFLSEGRLAAEFEDKLEKQLGLSNPVTVNSGTSALHLALIVAGVKAGDEVILPAQTFVATGLAVLQIGAVPVFADIRYLTGNIDPESVRNKITEKTKAVIPVHWAGYPCDMDEINSIAAEYGLTVIEDAAHALGAVYKNRPVGSISDITCFSFQAIKHLTTGDGGAACFKDKKNAKTASIKRWFGIDRENSKTTILGEREYDISEVGYKYHLNDYAAALGLANLENFQERSDRRREISARYRSELEKVPGIRLFDSSPDRDSANWLFGFHVEKRENFISALKERGVPTSVVHLGIDHNSIFGGKNLNLSNQREFDKSQINIPSHYGLDDDDVDNIISAVKQGW